MLATAQDGNHQIYPLAIAIVDVESNKSWSFFFEELKKSVVPDSVDTVFVSDRHVSIAAGIRNSYILTGHGFCIYHMFHNLAGNGSSKDRQDQWFRVAKAYTVEEYNAELQKLSYMSPSMVNDALKVDVRRWARAYFPSNRFNIMTTNNAECLNKVFKENRSWPVLAMLDEILQTFAKWSWQRREEAKKWLEYPSKEVTDILDKRYVMSAPMNVVRLSQVEAQVRDDMKTYEVDLHTMQCTCKKFQTDRIPCTHALAAARNRQLNVNCLVPEFYTNSAVKEVYKETVHLVPPHTQWTVPPSVSGMKILPPPAKRGPGRPRQNRYKAFWERRNKTVRKRCTRCGLTGHTYLKCTRGKRPAWRLH